MLIVALRAAPVFAATLKLTTRDPVSLAGTPVIHEGTPLLVQAHPGAVVTAKMLELAVAEEL